MCLQNRLGIDAETFDRAGRKIFHHHVAPIHHFEEKPFPGFGFQIERDAILVGVKHRKRHCGATEHAPTPGPLAIGRFDLDDPGACHRHHEGRVGAIVNMAEVDDGDTLQR